MLAKTQERSIELRIGEGLPVGWGHTASIPERKSGSTESRRPARRLHPPR
jgi:hypothetical protein